MNDEQCVHFLRWALPRLKMRWAGFRKVRHQVRKRLVSRLNVLHLPDVKAYINYLEAHPEEWSVLDQYCQITISRFYREKKVFEMLEKDIIPELIGLSAPDKKDTISIWSAGCSSGEEPYSLSVLRDYALRESYPGLKFTILATDINIQLLERARQGRYPASSIKNLPDEWQASAFHQAGEVFTIHQAHKAGIEFQHHDIRTPLNRGPFHGILCRNLVFTYYSAELQGRILQQLEQSLLPGGALIIGAREKLPSAKYGFENWYPGSGVFRKV
ncbi:CheR family methyltransferase [candidate division CSSED10-310 bacterium]|uniref:CheR family methyltransferase n=1 Tax=candidate division CSSED10-310 bacterium TaxID=2855610 RepID=A0ABV6Z6Q5_UNCC1